MTYDKLERLSLTKNQPSLIFADVAESLALESAHSLKVIHLGRLLPKPQPLD